MKTKSRTPSASNETTVLEVMRCRVSRKPSRGQDVLVREEPLEIRVRGKSVAVTMRTPGQDKELAVGFLLTEGVVRRASDIVEIAPCRESSDPENVLNVFLSPAVSVDFERLTRHVFASSSCGVCGKATIEAVHQQFEPIESDITISPATLAALPGRMKRAQKTFEATGGLHAAAIFDLRGKLLFSAEDVGRHNAVDKVIGWGLLKSKLPFREHVLLVSGRASFEIMQKALAARIAIVAAVSAPSSLAVEFARESGQTLIGFLRGDTMNLYAGATKVK